MDSSSFDEVSVNNDFQKWANTIASNITKISQNVSSMKKLINQPNFSQDSQEIWNQYDQIQNYTQHLAIDTSGLVKKLKVVKLSSPDHRQNKLYRERLSEEFISVLNAFQDTQRSAARKKTEEKKKIQEDAYRGDPFTNEASPNNLIELEPSMNRQDMLQMQSNIETLEQIESKTGQLENNITTLNEIFKELAEIVHNDSEIVDSIEANINRAFTHVEMGTDQLQQAATSQDKSRKKKFYMLLVLLVIIVILVIIFTSR